MTVRQIQLGLITALLLAVAARFGWQKYEEKQHIAFEHQQKCEKMGGSWRGDGWCLTAAMPDGFGKAAAP